MHVVLLCLADSRDGDGAAAGTRQGELTSHSRSQDVVTQADLTRISDTYRSLLGMDGRDIWPKFHPDKNGPFFWRVH